MKSMENLSGEMLLLMMKYLRGRLVWGRCSWLTLAVVVTPGTGKDIRSQHLRGLASPSRLIIEFR